MVEDSLYNSEHNDRCCMRCGRHENELKHFGEHEGYGMKLMRRYRYMHYVDKDERFEEILGALRCLKRIDAVYEIYGADEVGRALAYDNARNWLEKSWECTDCFHTPGDFQHYSWHQVSND